MRRTFRNFPGIFCFGDLRRDHRFVFVGERARKPLRLSLFVCLEECGFSGMETVAPIRLSEGMKGSR